MNHAERTIYDELPHRGSENGTIIALNLLTDHGLRNRASWLRGEIRSDFKRQYGPDLERYTRLLREEMRRRNIR